MPSVFECINARADAIKAARWAAYQPLSRRQLKDETVKDAQTNIETVTLDVGAFGQFVVLKRPTETDALRWQKHQDKIVQRRPTQDLRWCIYCHKRHPIKAFVHSPRYLHHLSYACKISLWKAKQRRWKYAPDCLTAMIK